LQSERHATIDYHPTALTSSQLPPDERVLIPNVERFWCLLTAVVDELSILKARWPQRVAVTRSG